MKLDTWIDHFARNAQNRPEPSWQAPDFAFHPKVKQDLLKSLTQFQLGDGGGPACLIGRDRDRYFAKYPGMRELVDLWFKEEQRHSDLLGKAVHRLGGTPITSHWSFSVFCGVRKCFGVRFELYALLFTEITSNNYYKMMRKYVGDPALVGMCQLIIRDETGHISFHRDRLARELDGPTSLGFFRACQMYILALAAGTMLWINHRKAIVNLGGSTREFYTGCLRETARFIRTTRLRRRGEYSPIQLIPVQGNRVTMNPKATKLS